MLLKRYIPSLLTALMLAVLAFGIFGRATPVSSHPTSPLFTVPSHHSKIALAYLAQQSGKPTDNFVIMNEYLRRFPLQNRYFKAFVFWDKSGRQSIELLVDMVTGEVVEDIASLEQQEAELRNAENGKLHPDLLDQLQKGPNGIELPVGIWVKYDTKVINNDILAELANRHPEVREAINKGIGPFTIDDEDLLQQLQNEYYELWNAKMLALAQALATALQNMGMEAQVTPGLPSITVTLSEQEIEELATRSDVQAILIADSEDGPYAIPRVVENFPFISLAAID